MSRNSGKILEKKRREQTILVSLQFEEGEKIITDFLKNKNVVLDDLKSEEILDYPKEIFKKGYIRTLPIYYKNFGEMDGFFIARLRKISDN